MEKNCEKLAKKNSDQKKHSKEKLINCMTNGKDTIIRLIVELIKKTSYKMSQYFPKPFRRFRGNIIGKLIFQIMQQKLS